MPNRKGRGRGRRGISEDDNLDIPVYPSEMVEAQGLKQEHEAAIVMDMRTRPKRKRLGEPRGLTVLNKFEESADGNLAGPANPLNLAEDRDDRGEVSETQKSDMFSVSKAGNASNSEGHDHQNGSMVQKKFQGSSDGKLDALISNIVEEVICRLEQEADNAALRKGCGRPKGSRSLKKFQRSADGNVDILNNPSTFVEKCTDFEEEQKEGIDMDTSIEKRGQGQPKGSMGKKSHVSADGNSGTSNDQSNLQEAGHGCEEEQEADICTVPKKKGRGRTRGLGIQMKRQQSADGKLDVLIHPTKMVAVGPGRKDFITELSVIVRQNARHDVCQWKKVPQSVKDTIMQKILDNWRLPDTVLIRRAIQDEAGRLYRNWRNRLHSYYLTFETKEEALKHVPDGINASDWHFLADYFSSPAFETISAKNKANKAKQTVSHACGRKSFHAVSYDARDKETGEEPDLRTLWQLTHKRANGEWVDEASKEIHHKVAQQIDQNSGNEIERIDPEIIKSAFKSLVGKKSYMQGIASGSSIRSQVKQGQAELEVQKKETEEATAKYNEVKAKLVEVESQLMEERRKREELEVRLLDRQREMDDINSHVQRAIQVALLSKPKLLTTEEEN